MNPSFSVGDSVHAVVQRRRGPEQTTRVDTVLAAQLFLGTRRLEAFFFPDDKGRLRYYDGVGRSLATAFLRNPIEFARISSRFNPRRFHPILRTWRAHKGTDYAASTGTPVRSIADGTVVRAVYNPGGYGNFVDIRHIGGLVTRYAHLRKIETKVDALVTAGQRIGQVGSTGRTTGPHLHFEVRIDGRPVDPTSALLVGRLERESPIVGRVVAQILGPAIQSDKDSEIDPPKQAAPKKPRPVRVAKPTS